LKSRRSFRELSGSRRRLREASKARRRARLNAAQYAEKPSIIFGKSMSRKDSSVNPDEAPPAAVLDTNVVLDWLVFRDARVEALTRAVTDGRLRWLACPRMRTELAHMLGHASLARWAPDAGAALARFDTLAALCSDPAPPRPAPGLHCSDPDDQVFVELALAHGARWLFTHDRALLKLARRAATHGLVIAAPQRWVAPTGP
jgi:predicted nucleic acid-binding protein